VRTGVAVHVFVVAGRARYRRSRAHKKNTVAGSTPVKEKKNRENMAWCGGYMTDHGNEVAEGSSSAEECWLRRGAIVLLPYTVL
jgi:hypothetical protein